MLRAALEATHAANERRNLELQARSYPGPAPIQTYLPPAPAQPTAPEAPAQPTAPEAPAQPTVPEAPAPSATSPAPAPAAAPHAPAATAAPAPSQPDRNGHEQPQGREALQQRQTDLERRLIEAGLSPRRAAALVAGAIAQRGPSSGETELADEVRTTIAAALPTPAPLRRNGAIAIVGAGGSGKTRATAALATAFAEVGAAVSVASFGGPAREDELGELLNGASVDVIPTMRERATARAVASARERGLVIVDTASAMPGVEPTAEMIAEALRSFELDAVYLALPATLSLSAALKLVSGFSAFQITGLVATHVDETDQLGVLAEVSMQTGLPVAYTHMGLELQTAIASADADDIATSIV